MNWVKKNVDRVALIGVAILTLVISGLWIKDSLGFPSSFKSTNANPDNTIPEPPSRNVRNARMIVSSGFKWTGENLFTSTPLVEKNGELIDMSKDEVLLRPPVANTFLVEHRQPFLQSNVLSVDSDEDGFTLLEEWEAKPRTSPSDPKAHPEITAKLCLIEMASDDYILEFAGDLNPQFQVTRKRPKRKVEFVEVGKSFFNGRFKLLEHIEKKAMNANGIEVNASVLVVQDTLRNQRHELPFRKDYNIATYFAKFRFALGDGEPITVKKGETFRLQSDVYRLEEIDESEASISKVDPGSTAEEKKIIKIPLCK